MPGQPRRVRYLTEKSRQLGSRTNTIAQANVARSPLAHSLLLQSAFCSKVDVVLVQEPWVSPTLARKMTKWYKAYTTLSSTDHWNTRPRVMAYARRDRQDLRLDLAPTISTLDSLVLDLYPDNNLEPIRLINVYNVPTGCTRAGERIEALLLNPELSAPTQLLIIGDFNLHHQQWEVSSSPPSNLAVRWADWAESKSLILPTPFNTATHN